MYRLIVLGLISFAFYLFVWLGVAIRIEGECLGLGYPDAKTTPVFDGYCINRFTGEVKKL